MAAVLPASALLARRPATPPKLPTGIPAIDAALGGLPRGALSELSGPCSSGRTTLLYSVLAQATRRGELVAIVDTFEAFDPHSAARAGVQLDRLLWVRCQGDLPLAFKAADLIAHAGGFGLVSLDISGALPRLLQQVPLSYWFRFQRAVQHTPALFLLLSSSPQAKSSSACWMEFEKASPVWSGSRPFRLLEAMRFEVTVHKPAPPRILSWEGQVV